MQITLLILFIGVLVLVFVAFAVMLFIWLFRMDFLHETDVLLEHEKNVAKAQAQKLDPPEYVPKLSMSRLALILSVGTLCICTAILIAAHTYLAVAFPDRINRLDLEEIKWILMLPVLGVLPYVFNQLRRVRL